MTTKYEINFIHVPSMSANSDDLERKSITIIPATSQWKPLGIVCKNGKWYVAVIHEVTDLNSSSVGNLPM